MREYFLNIVRSIKSIWIGLAVTLRYVGKHEVTYQYPDDIAPFSSRFRGFHEYEIEKCIACGMCVKICPAECITLTAEGKGKAATVTGYTIDYARCLFCALCVPVCPTSCVHMGKLHDLSGYSRAGTLVDFVDLARRGRRTPEPIWMVQARAKGAKAPAWIRRLDEHYRATAPIVWGPAAKTDRPADGATS